MARTAAAYRAPSAVAGPAARAPGRRRSDLDPCLHQYFEQCRGRTPPAAGDRRSCGRGAGISDIGEAHLGEAFFTTKPDGEGMGLGLFLAQATIQRLGGSVQLLNRSGGGACTRIELPLAGVLVRP